MGESKGRYANEMLTDPATITNLESDLISWLAERAGAQQPSAAQQYILLNMKHS